MSYSQEGATNYTLLLHVWFGLWRTGSGPVSDHLRDTDGLFFDRQEVMLIFYKNIKLLSINQIKTPVLLCCSLTSHLVVSALHDLSLATRSVSGQNRIQTVVTRLTCVL